MSRLASWLACNLASLARVKRATGSQLASPACCSALSHLPASVLSWMLISLLSACSCHSRAL
eukprot:8989678-Pyramimonas_sp.AAC.1